MKRIVTVQDISCVGKCSLTVALPILSACGVECAVIPTAVLSTHTAFEGFTFHDLTDEIPAISDHWKAQDLRFDAIYTGYLGSQKQLDLVAGLFQRFGTGNTIKIVDPVMGDGGKLYKGFSESFAQNMLELCLQADIIVPNVTEAAYMLKVPYQADCSEAYVATLLDGLLAKGVRCAAITGVVRKDEMGVLAYDKDKKQVFSCYSPRLPASFHGTGDVFASVLTGALMRDLSFDDAIRTAEDFVCACIRETMGDPDRRWYGVSFESVLPQLYDSLQKNT